MKLYLTSPITCEIEQFIKRNNATIINQWNDGRSLFNTHFAIVEVDCIEIPETTSRWLGVEEY